MGELEDWIDSVSGESNDETEPTYTKVFAQLYDVGVEGTETLVFTSDDSYRENGLKYEHSYEITDEHFSIGETIHMPPWLDESAKYMNSTIKTVKIVNKIKPKYTSCMFAGLTILENIEEIENLNTENTVDMSYMFFSDKSLTSIDLNNFDTRNVTNMSSMFAACQSLTSLDLSSFDTSNVTDMSNMFLLNPGNKLESITFGDKFTTGKVTDMSFMFTNCINITSLDLSKFDTSNVTNMSTMFSHCENLTNLDLSSFNTSKVTDMSSMFENCDKLESLDLSSFNTSQVTDMSNMFSACSNLSAIYVVVPNWTTAENADGMFGGCKAQQVTPKP